MSSSSTAADIVDCRRVQWNFYHLEEVIGNLYLEDSDSKEDLLKSLVNLPS